jgi:2-(acetamidomethylene)succinate hydrolase
MTSRPDVTVDAPTWTDRTIERSGALLHVVDWGGPGQTVLLTHGISAQAHVWDPVAIALRKHFRVLALDQRGHGDSSKPRAGYTATEFAADMAAVIEALADGPCIVMGHSLGGRNSLALAALHPEQVAQAVSVEFGPWISADSFRQLRERVLAAPASFESLEAAKAYLRARYSRLPENAIERRAKFGLTPAADRGLVWKYERHSMAATLDFLDRDLDELIDAIAAPVMVLHGAGSAFYDAPAFERLQSARPDFHYREVAHADHYLPEERPETLVELFLDFANSPPLPSPRRGRG